MTRSDLPAKGERERAIRLALREHAPLPGLPLFCSCGHQATTPYNRESHLVDSLIGAQS